MARKPSKKELAEAEQELASLGRGGKGKDDAVAKALAEQRRNVDAEPLNMNPDPRDGK